MKNVTVTKLFIIMLQYSPIKKNAKVNILILVKQFQILSRKNITKKTKKHYKLNLKFLKKIKRAYPLYYTIYTTSIVY
jgi:hypothetical protein